MLVLRQSRIAEYEILDVGEGRGLPPPGREEGWSRGRTEEGAAPAKASFVEATPLLASPLLQPPPAQGGGTRLPSLTEPKLARSGPGGGGLSPPRSGSATGGGSPPR